LPIHFSSLPPTADKQKIFCAVRKIIHHLHHNENFAYADIAQRASELLSRPQMKASLIKNFLDKKDTTRINVNNVALPMLYDYIRSGFQKFPTSTHDLVLEHWSTLVPDNNEGVSSYFLESEMERSLGVILKSWLKISDDEIKKQSAKMFGDFSGNYVLLRKSALYPDVIVRSVLKIDRASGRHALPRIRHLHYDRTGRQRISNGILLPMVANVYGVLKVENGEGLEFFALRNPIQWDFQKMLGFFTSMNMDRTILSSRIFIEREKSLWDGVNYRFTADDVKDRPAIVNSLQFLDKEKCLTIPDI